MTELRLLSSDRQHCGRCAPNIVMKRVAGIAFNFSLTDLNPPSSGRESGNASPAQAEETETLSPRAVRL